MPTLVGRLCRRAIGPAFLASLLIGLGAVPAFASPRRSVTVKGTLEVRHADDFGHGHSQHWYTLRTAKGRLALDVSGNELESLGGATLRVTGRQFGKTLKAGGKGSVKVVSSSTVVAGPQTKNVLVIMFTFSNNSTQPWTQTYANGVVFTNSSSIAAYYNEQSYGQLTMTGTVTPWLSIPNDNTSCQYGAWASAANTAAQNAGFTLSNYTNYVYAFPNTGSCGWAGLAYLPGSQSWTNGELDLRVVGHELGHNFGVHHANSYSCSVGGSRVWLADPANCSSSEYGDPFDIMGSSSTRHADNFHLAQFGFFGAGDKQDVTASETYSLGVVDQSASAPKVLRVARGATGWYFYLEYRQPFGAYFDNFGPTDPAVNGVTIRMGYDYSSLTQSQLLDATPATSTYADAPLAVGRSVTDPTSNVTFTNVSESSSGAVVNISWGTDTLKPTMPGNFQATSVSAASVGLSWTGSSDNVGVAGYRVFRAGNTIPLVTTTSTSFTDTGLSSATTYSYTVVAYDAANNVSDPASASATTSAVDVTPPSAPGTLTGTKKNGRIQLRWGPASDNVAVGGYRVYRNGVLVATVGAGVLTYTDRPPRGSMSYVVHAYDTSNNLGAASNTVTMALR
jgi:chitodextrinase